MDFKFLEVSDKELLERVFAFRYKVLQEIYPEYLETSGFSGTKEYDKYDKYSIHFAVLDEDNNICANVRLIHHSPLGYPTENSMTFDSSMFERERLGEMSRIFVDAKYRNMKTTMSIMNGLKRLMYSKMMNLGVDYAYGSLEESFLRLLRIYKINYQAIGEKQKHELFGLRYPSILYAEQLGRDNPEIIDFYRAQNEA